MSWLKAGHHSALDKPTGKPYQHQKPVEEFIFDSVVRLFVPISLNMGPKVKKFFAKFLELAEAEFANFASDD
jgi:hypothetical protein